MPQTHALAGIVKPTTLIRPERLSEYLGYEVLLAVETFQYTGSFKFRAAYSVVSNVPNRHIIAASSGNFGQAIAYSCKLLGKRCHIVMPDTSSKTKIAAVESYGGQPELVDVTKVSRSERVSELLGQFPGAYVASAFDDKWVIEGNSTLGVELLESGEKFDAIVAPVGGGGLTSGILTAVQRAGSKVEVYGAEPLLANDAARSLRAGHMVMNDREPQTLADGARTLSVGELNWPILKDGLAGIFEVSEEQLKDAIRQLFLKANLKAEPTGALSTGALLAAPKELQGKRLCCVVSGGNVDPDLYAELISG